MMLKVSLTTRADRNYSGNSYTVSHDNLEKGIYVEQLFPDVYHQYIDKIFVKAYAEEEYVEVVSKYGSCKFPIDKQSRWESGEIGLSYACCEVSITFMP